MVGSRKSLDSQFFIFFQKKKHFFQIFSEISEKIENCLKFVQIREIQRKKFENGSKTASFPPLLVPGNCQMYEKLAENFENSSKTASFHSFLNGWQQKISGFTIFSDFFPKKSKNQKKNPKIF